MTTKKTARRKKSLNKISKSEYIKLYAKWYDRLKREGFEDIEWFDPKTALGQSGHYMVKSTHKITKKYNEFTEEHYRLCRNFLTHFKFPNKKIEKIFELHTDGASYRDIIKELKKIAHKWAYRHYYYNKQGKPVITLFTLHKIVPDLIEQCYRWNKENPEGILHPSQQDFMADDLLLNEDRKYRDALRNTQPPSWDRKRSGSD